MQSAVPVPGGTTDPDADGVTAYDRVVAEIGRRARAAGKPAATTDPAQIAAIRRRVEATAASRAVWRRRLRLLRWGWW